jgi:hypothetical protein
MMKKVLLVMLLGLMAVFTPKPTADALVYRTVTETWQAYNFYSTYWGMRITMPLMPNTVEVTFRIPDSANNLDTAGGIDSSIVFSINGTSDTTIVLNTLPISLPNNTYTINLEAESIDPDVNQLTIWVMQSWTSMPSQYYEYWNSIAYLTIIQESYTIAFWDRLQLYDTTTVDEDGFPSRPIDPTPPSGSTFIGWRKADGTLYAFDQISPEDLNTNATLNLYATYSGFYDSGNEVITEPEGNAPAGLIAVFGAFGLDNDAGYIFLYILVMMIMMVTFMFWKLPTFVSIVVALAVTVLFLVMGLLPVYAAIVMMLIYAMGIMLVLRGGEAA